MKQINSCYFKGDRAKGIRERFENMVNNLILDRMIKCGDCHFRNKDRCSYHNIDISESWMSITCFRSKE